jgi:cysteinyl-tRNA synthetase
VGAEKMSKSLGNFTTVAELLERFDPRAYRLLVLRSQYRSQIEVTPETIADAEKALDRLDRLAQRFSLPEYSGLQAAPLGPAVAEGPAVVALEVERFCAHMDDDLDTPGALAGLFEAANRANALGDAGDIAAATALATTVAALCGVLGLALHASAALELDDETQRLVAERDAARAASDYQRADAIRDQLVALGWGVEDGPTGTLLRR